MIEGLSSSAKTPRALQNWKTFIVLRMIVIWKSNVESKSVNYMNFDLWKAKRMILSDLTSHIRV